MKFCLSNIKIHSIIPAIVLLLLFEACTGTNLNRQNDAVEGVSRKETKITAEEASKGLKNALILGISKGSAQASQPGGYYKNPLLKILIPPELQVVSQKLRSLGMNKIIDDFELSLNKGAEEAAKQAKPIFVNAITSIKFQDAWNILKGQEDAATVYLRDKTTAELKAAFLPVVSKSLQRVNATKYYTDIINIYNKIPAVQRVDADLEGYVTEKSIEGLFVLVKQEEANIRQNPLARVTSLLKRVFSSENTH